MNAFTDGIAANNYYGCALDLEPDDQRHGLFRKQRLERGFDDTETWHLCRSILEFTLPRLKRFREVSAGYPEDMTPETWNTALGEMIFAIETYLRNDRWEFPETPEQEAVRDRVYAGLDLFQKHLWDLWW